MTTPANVTVKLDNGNGKTWSETLEFNPKEVKDLDFAVSFNSEWPNGQYTGSIASVGGFNFTEKFGTEMIDTKLIVVFQLSSLLYNPGDLVLFRVILLDQKFRPIDDKTLLDSTITITVN